MTPRRAILAAGLAAGVGLPLALPLAVLLRQPSGWSALAEPDRLAALAASSLALAAGAVLLAVPAGAAAAVLLERTPVPGASFLRAAVAVGLFVPLPVYAAAWQAVLGSWLPPDAGGWRPWRQGLLPAVWVHAAAGLPWAVWVVSLGLRATDPRLEDDALLAGGWRAVVWRVLWPRARAAAGLAACWVAVQTLTETTVTDVMMARTFAEEVYTQLVSNPAGVAGAVAATVPGWLLATLAAVWVGGRAGPALPANPAEPGTLRPLPLGTWARRTAAILLWLGGALLVGPPLAGLVVRTGSLGQLATVARAHGPTLADSLLWSGVAGLAAAGLALPACRLARDSRWFAGLLLLLTAAGWVTPAPLVGLGLKEAIDLLLSAEESVLAALGLAPEFPPLRSLLYDQPSPVPGVWAAVVRFFPVAVALLWPTVRSLPRDLLDAATLDGGRRAQWRAVVWPLARPAFARAAVAVAVLSLGEVVAGKLVQPPGRQSFVQELFNAMHYGADATVAAMSLLQVAATAAVCGLLLRRPPG